MYAYIIHSPTHWCTAQSTVLEYSTTGSYGYHSNVLLIENLARKCKQQHGFNIDNLMPHERIAISV